MTSNYVDSTGLHLQTLAEIVTELEDGFKTIFGANINVAANSPDGQMINLYAQAKIDLLDLITDVYNSFSPSQAVGIVLDQRAALNGVVRHGATYTYTYVTITADRAVALTGLDTSNVDPFTVSDSAGNKFYLVTGFTTSIGANAVLFRAALAGAVLTTVDTITTIETITLGITAVNNSGTTHVQGIDEETDAALRYRRAQSVAIPSIGYLEGLIGALLAIDGVLYATVYENDTGTTDGDGIPAHSIWAVVDGGAAATIADVIYKKRNGGCGMYGAESETIDQINGQPFEVNFDRPDYEDLYIQLELQSIDSDHAIDPDYIKAQILASIAYGINAPADFTAITAFIKALDPYALIISGGVGIDGINYDPFIYPSTIASRFVLETANIDVTVI
jgi:uncharacterized phage protein gp47/JayE